MPHRFVSASRLMTRWRQRKAWSSALCLCARAVPLQHCTGEHTSRCPQTSTERTTRIVCRKSSSSTKVNTVKMDFLLSKSERRPTCRAEGSGGVGDRPLANLADAVATHRRGRHPKHRQIPAAESRSCAQQILHLHQARKNDLSALNSCQEERSCGTAPSTAASAR